MYKTIFIAFISLCGNHPVSAQRNDLGQKEQELILIHKKLTGARSGEFDSLNYYSDLFTEKLQNLLSSDKKTLKYSFKALTEAHICYVKTSKDGTFRIYSWDSQLGGTMHFFNVIYQYRNGKTMKTQSMELGEGDPAWYCSDLFTLKTKKTTYYLAVINGIYSSKDVSQSIKAFELNNAGVNDSVLLMKTPEGMKNSLDLAYDFFSVYEQPERPIPVITYDSKKKIITVSTTNDKGEIVPGSKSYRFNGIYFELSQVKTQ
ncbi:MAG: hypothetical protein K0S23_3371 [Fluviicola sp.]|jgi:hypothetical protein|uniref:hypothetical protein n=1 Tax=Fluviicola sp. TaxID=1917219 RepID=UPI0026228385|nr:hypothetical protein [Fluviicola sp.]MDF3029064.1 hypothetical protein [Fluviicola sp.]